MRRARRWVPPRSVAAVIGLGTALGLGPFPAGPAGAQLTGQVVNGAPESAEPTTAALVQGDAATGRAVCSAVLIGCDTAVTAAHCFNSDAALKATLFFQHAGFVPIESATRHPAYVDAVVNRPPGWLDVLRVEDIAFLKLATPVSGVAPSTPIQGPRPAPGTPGRVVGFGRNPVTEATSFDPNGGIKRSGSMELTACTGELEGFDILCWEPDESPSDPGEDVSLCDGDSGGPLFVDEGGVRVVAGIAKGVVFDPDGQADLCLPPVQPFDTNVARHRAWLDAMVASTGAVDLGVERCSGLPALPEEVLSTPCDGLPWSPGDAPRTCGFQGELGGELPLRAEHVFQVPPETELLRVAHNGIVSQTGEVDTDFYVRAGAPATTEQHDCRAAAAGNLGFCEFPSPEAGPWYVLARQVAGEGEYQVTVSLFGPGASPVPGPGTAWRVLLVALLAAAASWGRLRGRRRARARG